MAAQVTNYQCPNCLAGLRFDGATGKLACDSCDNSFDVAVVEQLFADKEQAAASAGTEPQWDISLANSFSAEEAAHMRGYACPSCAAEIVCDDTTAATSCPYCGNPTVVPGQFSDQLKPDYVVPFKLDKNAAVEALKKFYKGKKFLPKSFSDASHIEEVKGVYVPFWLFDGETDSSMRFRATKKHSHTSGDYRITETKHYRVTRAGYVAFEKVPVDGSSKMPDAHMDSIEPYDYRDLKAFSSAYLPGFLANKYDEDAEMCSKRANERIIASTEKAFRSTITGYSTVTREYCDIRLKKGDVRYALMPVWLLTTKWGGKGFLFAMNGQTGKLVGDLPVDRPKFWAWLFGIAAPATAALAAALYIWGRSTGGVGGGDIGMSLGISAVASLLVSTGLCLFWRSKMKTAKTARLADDYIPAGGFRLTGQADIYLYRTVTRTRIASSSASSGGGGRMGGGRMGGGGRGGGGARR